MKLLSDQMTEGELKVIQRELRATLQRGVAGDVTEFGCYVGTTSVILAEELAGQQPLRTLYLYDSFSGLPEKTSEDISPAGEQFVAGELHASRQELERNIRPWRGKVPLRIHKGWFNEIPVHKLPQQIAFAFLDGDYYRSILDPLALIWSKLQPGACTIVDDYTNEALPGAAQAVHEWAQRYALRVRSEQSLAIFYKPE